MTGFHHDLGPELAERLTLDERSGPAPRLSRDRALVMVDQALDEALMVQAGPRVAASKSPTSGKRSLSYGWLASAAAILLALGGSAFAAVHYWAERTPAEPSPARAPALQARALPPPAEAPAIEPPVSAAAPEPVPTRREPSHAVRAETTSRAEPEDLLQAANHLRAQGRFDAAAEVYALVHERYPGSISAYTAEVARATLELEHRGNPRLARTLFARALRAQPKGALDIEVRQGLALALHDLGESAAEAQVLRGLIASHADSPAAKRAGTQLREIESRAR